MPKPRWHIETHGDPPEDGEARYEVVPPSEFSTAGTPRKFKVEFGSGRWVAGIEDGIRVHRLSVQMVVMRFVKAQVNRVSAQVVVAPPTKIQTNRVSTQVVVLP